MYLINRNRNAYVSNRRGFTLVEIMIVVLIIGVLAALAGVAYTKSRAAAQATATAHDLRTFAGAFEMFAMYEGYWPDDGLPSTVPYGMNEFFKTSAWKDGAPVGGEYDWEFDTFGIWAAVSIYHPEADAAVLTRVDEILDDGNLSTGLFRSYSSGVMYILEE